MTALLLAYVYLRLSEEEFKCGESSSIQNQRIAIRQYCERHGITIIREFVDDGFSGGNFDRPGFNEMLRYLQKKEVHLKMSVFLILLYSLELLYLQRRKTEQSLPICSYPSAIQ